MGHRQQNIAPSRSDPPPDFELILHPHGAVSLIDKNDDDRLVWSSDNDEDFTEEFEGQEFFGDDDADEILDYLDSQEYVNLDEDEVDVVEEALDEDYDSDESSSTMARKLRKKP